MVEKLSVKYAQWSIAAEEAAIESNPQPKQSDKQKGRGQPPVYTCETLASKSSELFIEHHIWSQASPIARAGSDLFSTLWATVAGALRTTASARRLDGNDPNAEGEHTRRAHRLYSKFFQYLVDAPKSPFAASLTKLELKQDRWRHILAAPFYCSDERLDEWASEATKMSKTLETKARQGTTKTLISSSRPAWRKTMGGSTSS